MTHNTIDYDSESTAKDLIEKKQDYDKLTNGSITDADVTGIGLAEAAYQGEIGFLPAIQLSIDETVHTVFLETDIQSKKEALRKISDIPNLKSKGNVFVRSNKIYLKKFHIETSENFTEWEVWMCIVLSLTSIATFFSTVVLGFGSLFAAMSLGALSIPMFIMCSMAAILNISSEKEVCDFKTAHSIDGVTNTFTEYNIDDLFNEESQRVVEVSARDDSGLRVETTEGDIMWIVKSYRGLPAEDLSKYQIGDDGNDIRYAERALVKENDGSTDGLISKCGEYVIPAR